MKSILLSIFTLAALASCSKSENPTEGTPQDGVIRIFTGVDAPGTKAVVSQATGLSGAQFIRVEGDAPTDFSSTATSYAHTAGTIEATSGKVTFTSTPTYNMNDAKSWFVAYYPAGTLTNNVVTWNINGSTDILRTDAAWDAGKYSAPLTGATGTKLILNHQLSQVEVICKAESGSAISAVRAAWGKISKIEFLDAPTTMTYTLSDLAVANGTTTANFALLKSYADADNTFEAIDIPESSNDQANAMAMLAPVAPTATESFKLKITTEGSTTVTPQVPIEQTVLVSLDGSKATMVKAQRHVVTLTFKADGKDVAISNTTIEDWADGAAGSNDVVKP